LSIGCKPLAMSLNTFDLGFAYNVLMDVEDVPAAMREIRRVLRSSQPLEYYMAALGGAVLAVSALQEPVPDARHPCAHLEVWSRVPLFLWPGLSAPDRAVPATARDQAQTKRRRVSPPLAGGGAITAAD